MKYRKNARKNIKLINILVVILILIIIIWILPTIIVKNLNQRIFKKNDLQYKVTSNVFEYNITDLIKALKINNTYSVDFDLENNVTYTDDIKLNVNIKDFMSAFTYDIKIFLNNSEILSKNLASEEELIHIKIQDEGKNEISIQILKDNDVEYDNTMMIYYIKPYNKQFLDELSNKGVEVHFRQNNKMEDYKKSFPLIKALGAKYLRADIFYSSVNKGNQNYNFTFYDNWINDATSNGLKIILEFNGFTTRNGKDIKFDTDEEFNEFETFINQVMKRYPQISNFEILNEPNFQYTSEDDIKNYSKLVELANNCPSKNENTNIIAGALAQITNTTKNKSIATTEFFNKLTLFKGYENSSAYSYHPYDGSNIPEQSPYIKEYLSEYKNIFNDYGGFLKNYVSEFGISSFKDKTDEIQSEKLIQQSVLLDNANIDVGIIYNFWNIGNDKELVSNNYGIIENNYTPKLAYYAVKKYYENTNGGEYIGTVKLADGLEAHVYDKDGQPKIIAWSNNSNNTISIDYKDFTAKDIYGNDIPNTNGKLEITTSPVYLDNVSNKYYYEAISNSALEKYSEFQNKFGTEIASVNGLQNSINSLKQYMTNIATLNAENENTAKQKMKDHFNLGNQILEAYKNGNLKVEYVKLSSMLDMLNDIGDSYEDLVTVSSKTRNPDIQGTKSLVDNAEQILNNNSDIDIVYPKKILDFSKDLYQKADYINNLTEENPIKTGLIVSNDLHAKYLANWATTFANIYVDDYIKNNPINESYSETNWTNKDVTVTLNIGNDTKITNNSGKNTYTFSNNGKFTFQYERRGRTFTKEVKVNNIDKTSPVITGVENNKTYYNTVTPKVTDEHLKEVQLKKNGQVIDGYKSGNEIKDAGKYELIGKDIAGNETKIEFEIIHKFTISSKIYSIKDKYIIGIKHNTKLKDFDKELKANDKYKISRNNKEIKDGDIIATGDILETENGQKYYLIVQGDINKDGNTNITDLVKIRRKILSMEEFDEYQTMAADLAIDNKINITDLVRIRRIILGYGL